MRILAVCAVAHPGGAEIGLLRLAKRLLARGHALTLATPQAGPLDDAGLPVVRLQLGGLQRGGGARAALSFPRARRLASDHDLVYLNGTVSGRLLPGLAGRRTILHVHDIVDRVPRFWSRAGAVLADSGAVAERLAGLHAHVVYCPVELDAGGRDGIPAPWSTPPGDAPRRPVVGFVGRIEPRKGPLDLVHAAPQIRAGKPDARIVIVGDDPYDSAPEYAAQVRRAEGVEHVSWVPDGAAVMRHLDVLVAPSRQEPFGTVLAEAMAAGTPVVATRVGGLAEVVVDGVTGRLVTPGRPDELAAAVLEVLADRDRMGAAAREQAQRFGADAYADRVEQILLRVVAG
ncbi:MAG: glycosyltransferase family 4 protein [Solirubrobacteraceae bacterium]|nr:glycosyltransferase family 4 protein [Solirubrobacteraceae bacterium]